jgi:hypothetical protein
MPSPGNKYKDDWLRCNECRTRRATFTALLLHRAAHKECRPCDCGGYHFSHRPGSPYCYKNPTAEVRHALRRGEDDEVILDILIDIAFRPQKPYRGPCPF